MIHHSYTTTVPGIGDFTAQKVKDTGWVIILADPSAAFSPGGEFISNAVAMKYNTIRLNYPAAWPWLCAVMRGDIMPDGVSSARSTN